MPYEQNFATLTSILVATMHPLIESYFCPIHSIMRRNDHKHGLRKEERRSKGQMLWEAHLPSAISEDQQSLLFIDRRNVSSQQQSYLFGKLPLELREIIYAYALCGKELQVEISGDEGLNLQHRGPHAPLELRCPYAQRLLAFPKSCRLAYVHYLLFFLF
jgi:hypothetical protein